MDSTVIGALLVASATVTLFNLTRLLQVKMPERKHPGWAMVGSKVAPSPEQYARQDKAYNIEYLKKTIKYLLAFLIPATASALAFVLIVGSIFDKGVGLLASSFLLTIISVAYQKIRMR